jgi:hypothetical protein
VAENARALTDQIRLAGDRLARLALQAYEGRVWEVLGYTSWRAYAQAEFGFSQSRAYQLLDAGRVVAAVEEASSTDVEITEAAARDLKPVLPDLLGMVRTAVAEVDSPAERKKILTKVLSETRAALKAEAPAAPSRRGESKKIIAEWEARRRPSSAGPNGVGVVSRGTRSSNATAGYHPVPQRSATNNGTRRWQRTPLHGCWTATRTPCVSRNQPGGRRRHCCSPATHGGTTG